MILKGSQRGGPRQLAKHLLNDRDNDHVSVEELRGFASDNLFGAMAETLAVSRGTRCQQPVFSLSINPPKDANVTKDDLFAAADKAGEALALGGQPRAVIFHEKGARLHAHVVWSRIRERMGQRVFIFDPFNVLGKGTHRHNPCAELKHSSKTRVSADAALLADAIIVDQPKDPHWPDSAKLFIKGIVLYLLVHDPDNLSLMTLRRLMSDLRALHRTLQAMALSDALNGTIRNIGLSFLQKMRVTENGPRATEEMLSVLATLNAQTWPLDDLQPVFSGHDFSLEIFSKSEQPTTAYLILPATLIPTHSRWLRLFVTQLIATMERHPLHRDRLPLWLILEEFAALGYMRSIEAAAGYCAGFGVKLWTVLQDLTQIKTHYPNSWETFLGNAGLIQAFGNVDVTTTKYLSDLLGQTTIIEEQKGFVTADQRANGDDGVRQNLRSVPLLSPSELTLYFARERSGQLVLVPGQRPVFLSRLPISEEV